MGVHGMVVYCQDYKCSHSQTLRVCGKRGADMRPDFNWSPMKDEPFCAG